MEDNTEDEKVRLVIDDLLTFLSYLRTSNADYVSSPVNVVSAEPSRALAVEESTPPRGRRTRGEEEERGDGVGAGVRSAEGLQCQREGERRENVYPRRTLKLTFVTVYFCAASSLIVAKNRPASPNVTNVNFERAAKMAGIREHRTRGGPP